AADRREGTAVRRRAGRRRGRRGRARQRPPDPGHGAPAGVGGRAAGARPRAAAPGRERGAEPLERIRAAVRRIVEAYPDVRVVLPAHANPAVRAQVEAGLAGVPRVTITDPLPSPSLARVLSQAYLTLTDSGGIQEEAPSFRVPALVLREVTERPELIERGGGLRGGTEPDRIVRAASRLLRDEGAHERMRHVVNPFGDGRAAERIVAALDARLAGRRA